MKKVLIIGFLHPFTHSGGSFRTLPLARFLPEFGWEPIVLTPDLTEKPQLPFRIIETPYRDVLAFWKKLFGFKLDAEVTMQVNDRFKAGSGNSPVAFFLTRIGEIVNYPDSYRGWKPYALAAANDLLTGEKIDVIFSCHPTISHIIAGKLKTTYKIPWMADFPDLWSQNHNYSYSKLRRAIDRRLELKTLHTADALSTVSQPWADKLSAFHKGKETQAITNGFDPGTVNAPAVKLTDNFTLTFTGNIYAGKNDPSRLFTVLADLVSTNLIDKNDFKVRFYGGDTGWLERQVEHFGILDIVNIFPQVSKETALEKQRESQVLFLAKWNDRKEPGVHSGKLFEYLAARRPILAAGGFSDVVTDLLNETEAGIDALTTEDIKEALLMFYNEYKKRGEVTYNGISSEIDKFSHREMARHFSEILDRLVS